MKIAVPLNGGSFCAHFGGADAFALVEVDSESRAIRSVRVGTPPPHQHGVFPVWLRDQGVNTVLAGGMGPRAAGILQRFGIDAVVGIAGGEPEQLVKDYLAGTLVFGGDTCGGGQLHRCGEHGRPTPRDAEG